MNIICSVIPLVDLALSQQVYRALEAEHLRAYEWAFFCPHPEGDRAYREASFNLAVKEAQMYKTFEATLKARSN